MAENPEIGKRLRTGGFETNFHDQGRGDPVLLIHGSGPGVTAWANWRLVISELGSRFRVIAPDMVGFATRNGPKASTIPWTPGVGARWICWTPWISKRLTWLATPSVVGWRWHWPRVTRSKSGVWC